MVSLGSVAAAQDAATGALNGVVRDGSGAVVAGAKLRLRQESTGENRTVSSDGVGEFLFSLLPPGRYRLVASADGFAALQVEAIAVAVGRTTRLLPRLQAGGTEERILVMADDAPAFDSPLNADLSPEQLAALPEDGRRFQSLAALTPLVSAEDAGAVRNPDEESAPAVAGDADNAQLAVRGQDPALNRFMRDGLDGTRHFDGQPRGGSALPFGISKEAVQEFGVRAVAAGLSSRGGGGAVHTVSRRGGESWHGAAFFLLRNSAADASNPFSVVTRYNGGAPTLAKVKPRDQRERIGGSMGRRIAGGLYGFAAAEVQRRSFPAISTPSDEAFYALTPVQMALLENRGVGAAAVSNGLAFLDSLSGPVDRHADEVTFFPRLDWDGRRGTFSAEWNHVRFRSPAGQNALPVVARGRGSLADVAARVDDGTLHGAATLSPRWLADARVGYSRDVTASVSPQPLPQEPHTAPGGGTPEVDLSDVFSFGSAPAPGLRRMPNERIAEGAVALHFEGRSHHVTLGAEMLAVDERIAGREADNGRFRYTNSRAASHAGALVDFLTDFTYNAAAYPNGGCPSIYAQPHYFCFASFTQTFGSVAETRFHTAELSAFVQDGWRPTARLRITAAARYQWDRMPPPQHPNVALDAVFGGFASTSMMPSDTNNLAPYVGVAYAASSRTVVRLGYGFLFSGIPGSTMQRALADTAQASAQRQVRVTPRTIVDPLCSSGGTNFGYPATYLCPPTGPVAATGAAWMFSRSFQMPTVQTAELSVSEQIAPRTHVSGSYVLALSRELTNTVDLNIAPATSEVGFRIVRNGGEPGARGGEVYRVPQYKARRTPDFGPVTAILSDGNGIYHALALTLSEQTARLLTLRTSWTFSKSLDTLRSGPTAGNENAHFDPFQPLYDRAASNFDHRHRVMLLAVWEPEHAGGERAMRQVWNGWSFAPVMLFQSGHPYSYNLSGGTELDGGRESLNGSGGANYLPSVGRNTLRLPWTESVDVRVSRVFGVGRGNARLRLSGEAFNLLNHVNVTAVEQRAFLAGDAGADGVVPLTFQDSATLAAEGSSGGAFGTASESANSPARERRLQAGVRLEW